MLIGWRKAFIVIATIIIPTLASTAQAESADYLVITGNAKFGRLIKDMSYAEGVDKQTSSIVISGLYEVTLTEIKVVSGTYVSGKSLLIELQRATQPAEENYGEIVVVFDKQAKGKPRAVYWASTNRFACLPESVVQRFSLGPEFGNKLSNRPSDTQNASLCAALD